LVWFLRSKNKRNQKLQTNINTQHYYTFRTNRHFSIGVLVSEKRFIAPKKKLSCHAELCKFKIHEKIENVCASMFNVYGTAVKTFASKFLEVIEIIMTHCWDQFLGNTVDISDGPKMQNKIR